uniref:CRISPR-associated helicase Cas3' n=1 Tax=Candidatus Electrothrix sp. TaxID=2170559 RepID=UPI004055A917
MNPVHSIMADLSDDKTYFLYWAKTDRSKESSPGTCHLLPYHCLDVAAVGSVLLRKNRPLLDFFTEHTGLDEQTFTGLACSFLALHDVGKFSEAFQGLQEDLLYQFRGRKKSKPYDHLHHDSLGFLLWRDRLAKQFCSVHLAEHEDLWDWQDFLEIWALACTGHHGQPPKGSDRPLLRWFLPENLAAAEAFSRFCGRFFLQDIVLAAPIDFQLWSRQMRCLSWWLAGFAVLCDWLGSNSDFFPLRSEPLDLENYWQEIALPAAERIIQNSDILPLPCSTPTTLSGLFPTIHTPTPLQAATAKIDIKQGAHLFILEDVTGAGKTEAAFMLLHRLMTEGRAEGAYFALPTMATANAMYQRTGAVYRQLYAEGSSPSLVLAHGSRHLMDGFVRSVLPASPNGQLGQAPAEDREAAVSCAAWLADNRKKALLAHIGAGTVDQALLAVLCSRHQSMRLLGLRNKVLIVDEVHACDAYMHQLLQVLLTFHAAAGGSAILLSATLPSAMREELLAAYAAGLGQHGPVHEKSGYPLLTLFTAGQLHELEIATRNEVRRKLSFTLFREEQEALDLILEKTRQGQCVAWVRNTVADAIESYTQLRTLLPQDRIQDKIMLFHARFALSDRLALEEQVLARFGKDGEATDRQGRVLIATQVIEQSLDLDFDCMISDLAPIDLLIQRAGRLRRHTRDRQGNPIDRPDERGAPTLHVLGPEPSDDAGAGWFSTLFPTAVKVYDDHGRLWLTARYLQENGQLRVPEDMRSAVEYVYGPDSEVRIPEGLVVQSREAETGAMTDRSLAKMNSINFAEGYTMPDHSWWDESVTPTRLGEPSIALRLAKWRDGRLRPWSAAEQNPWSLSEVSVRKRLAAEEAVPQNADCAAAMAALQEQWGGRRNFSLLVPLVEIEDGTWQGCVKNGQGEEVPVRYSPDTGLVLGG